MAASESNQLSAICRASGSTQTSTQTSTEISRLSISLNFYIFTMDTRRHLSVFRTTVPKFAQWLRRKSRIYLDNASLSFNVPKDLKYIRCDCSTNFGFNIYDSYAVCERISENRAGFSQSFRSFPSNKHEKQNSPYITIKPSSTAVAFQACNNDRQLNIMIRGMSRRYVDVFKRC